MARYIDADECLDTMRDEMAGTGYQNRAMNVVKYAPTADVVEVKYGEWKMLKYPLTECTSCHITRNCEHEEGWNYCPNCGVKMIVRSNNG